MYIQFWVFVYQVCSSVSSTQYDFDRTLCAPNVNESKATIVDVCVCNVYVTNTNASPHEMMKQFYTFAVIVYTRHSTNNNNNIGNNINTQNWMRAKRKEREKERENQAKEHADCTIQKNWLTWDRVRQEVLTASQ